MDRKRLSIAMIQDPATSKTTYTSGRGSGRPPESLGFPNEECGLRVAVRGHGLGLGCTEPARIIRPRGQPRSPDGDPDRNGLRRWKPTAPAADGYSAARIEERWS